eukprot:GHVN01055812.1.p1 GENE.GHVN01055812.1~~GHVN01055812.1.p1  ORF type:complete len:209 (-),score=43.52 GHVN01055812.1:411-983(-)
MPTAEARSPSTVEELSSDSDDTPQLEEVSPKDGGDEEGMRFRFNRSEKKGRKAVEKMGMKEVPHINKVTIRRAKNIFFVINNPTVFKYPHIDTYIVFGDAKIEDLNLKATTEAAQQYANMSEGIPSNPVFQPSTATVKEEDPSASNDDDDDINANDLELVMSQSGCTKAKAIELLRKHGDVINAILDVTN